MGMEKRAKGPNPKPRANLLQSIADETSFCPLGCGIKARIINIRERSVLLVNCPNCGMFAIRSEVLSLLRGRSTLETQLLLVRRFVVRHTGELTLITIDNFSELAARQEECEGHS